MAIHPTKIVALNIRKGGEERKEAGNRVIRLCNYLDAQKADVIVLTEWRNNANGRDFANWSREKGLNCEGLADGGTENGVFVASKIPFTARSVTPPRPGNDPTRAGVMMLTQAASWTMLACYFPLGNGDAKIGIKPPKPPFFAAIAEVAVSDAEENLIVIGELNNGHRERDREKRGANFVGPEDFEALSGKAGPDLVDLWQRTHGNDAREYSYMSAPGKVSTAGNGFRIDHAFGNQVYLRQMRPVCHYDHANRLMKLADHSALIVTCGTQ